MEKTVYYLCKETLRMSQTGEVAFTKGLFYKLVDKYVRDYDGETIYKYVDDLGARHTLDKEHNKKHMVKVKDKVVASVLEKGVAMLSGTYYICKKTMKMRVTGEVALKKGKIYSVDERLNQVNSDYLKAHQMSEKGMDKYLVKIIDRSVLEEQ